MTAQTLLQSLRNLPRGLQDPSSYLDCIEVSDQAVLNNRVANVLET